MSVKFFCKICDKKLWEQLSQNDKETTTIAEAEETCICSDCFMKSYEARKD